MRVRIYLQHSEVRFDLDGTLFWTDPTGRERTTLPLDLLQRVAAQPTRMVEERAASDGEAELPSLVEESLEHLVDAHLIELACRPGSLTARNPRFLQAGRRVCTSSIGARTP